MMHSFKWPNGLLLAALLFVQVVCFSQARALRNDAVFVVGVEGNYSFHDFTNSRGGIPAYSYGLNLGYPYGKVTFGLGILRTSHGEASVREYTGETFTSADYGEEIETHYIYNYKTFAPQYITLSNRIQFRFPCNCVFLHAGYNISILDKNVSTRSEINDSRHEPTINQETINLNKKLAGLEIGIGFKLDLRQNFRLVMRQTMATSRQILESQNNIIASTSKFLTLSIGIQKGFL